MLLTVDLERLEVGPGDRVLDAGCGEGRHCFGCLERGADVIGLDLDFAPLRDTSKRLRSRAAERIGMPKQPLPPSGQQLRSISRR